MSQTDNSKAIASGQANKVDCRLIERRVLLKCTGVQTLRPWEQGFIITGHVWNILCYNPHSCV